MLTVRDDYINAFILCVVVLGARGISDPLLSARDN